MKGLNLLIVVGAVLAASVSFGAAGPPLRVERSPVPVLTQQAALTKTERDTVLTNLMREMEAQYVDAELAKTISASLKAWMGTQEYAGLNQPLAFANRVNALLKEQVTDAHLRFQYSPTRLPERANPREPSPEEIASMERMIRFANAGFEKVERLPGNIGYIRFLGFQSPEDMRRPVEAAMKFLADTDAMVIDLRANGGGSPAGVQLFCSAFFGEEPVHLNSIYFRPTNETREFWTLTELDWPRYTDKPVYVLVSPQTGSGAEECAYNFQTQKRGVIIGEPTWGGANPGATVRLSDHFSCFIPVGRAINPVTKTNWEGTGVIPDVKVPATDALARAQVLALDELIKKESNPTHKAQLERIRSQVGGSSN